MTFEDGFTKSFGTGFFNAVYDVRDSYTASKQFELDKAKHGRVVRTKSGTTVRRPL
jgi:hypothetical protein